MDWYDFKVDINLREYFREYFMELKVFRWTQEEVMAWGGFS